MTDTAAALDTSAEPVDIEPFPRAPGRSRRVTDVILCVLLVALSLGFSVRHVSGHHQTSPIDEYVYIDYYAKVLHQGVVRQGEKTGDYAREYYSCHPNRVFGAWQPQLCAPHRHRP